MRATRRRTHRDGADPARRRRRPIGVTGLAALAALLTAACGGDPNLETRTFEVRYLDPGEAAAAVEPYVYDDRPEAPGKISTFSGGITVRETADNLERIARMLERVDREKPAVRLHFQVIAADGAADRDPRLAEVESALRELFRFEGYELIAETQMGAVEGGSATQTVEDYWLATQIQRVRSTGQSGSVTLEVRLASREGNLITTAMTVPAGQTVVLGSARVDPDRPTVILAVRPELIRTEAASAEDRESGPSG